MCWPRLRSGCSSSRTASWCRGTRTSVPISGQLAQRYPTNWELAGARAASVVRIPGGARRARPAAVRGLARRHPALGLERDARGARCESTHRDPADSRNSRQPGARAERVHARRHRRRVSGSRGELEALFRTALRAVEPGPAVRRAIERHGTGLRVAGVALPDDARCVVLAPARPPPRWPPPSRARQARASRAASIVTKDAHGGEPVARHRSPRGRAPAPRCAERGRRRRGAGVRRLGGAQRDAGRAAVRRRLGAHELPAVRCRPRGPARDDRRSCCARARRSTELNCVRKHLTRVSGGRLAAATRAGAVVVLAISDVLGDDWATLGSGPCAADPSTYGDALAVLRGAESLDRIPAAVRRHLEAGRRRPPARVREAGRPRARPRAERADRKQPRRTRGRARRSARVWPRGAHRDRPAARRGELGRPAGRGARAGAPARSAARCCSPVARRPSRCAGAAAGAVRRSSRSARRSRWPGTHASHCSRRAPTGATGRPPAAGAYADGETVARGAAAGLDARAALDGERRVRLLRAREGGLLRDGADGHERDGPGAGARRACCSSLARHRARPLSARARRPLRCAARPDRRSAPRMAPHLVAPAQRRVRIRRRWSRRSCASRAASSKWPGATRAA